MIKIDFHPEISEANRLHFSICVLIVLAPFLDADCSYCLCVSVCIPTADDNTDGSSGSACMHTQYVYTHIIITISISININGTYMYMHINRMAHAEQ